MAKAAGSRQRDLVFYLRDAGITALMTLPIAFPMFGFYLIMGGEGRASGGYGTGVEPRLMWVVVAVLLVFVGRFIISFLRNDPALTGVTQKSAIETRRYMSETIGPWIGPGLLSLALLWPLLPFVDRWLLDLGILVLTYIMLGWGLNIVVGLAGLLDLGYVAFYAVGAYSYALIALNYDLSFGNVFPWQADSLLCSGYCWVFQCCVCAVIIWPL